MNDFFATTWPELIEELETKTYSSDGIFTVTKTKRGKYLVMYAGCIARLRIQEDTSLILEPVQNEKRYKDTYFSNYIMEQLL